MIAAVIATRNEAETIGILISRLAPYVERVYVSDESDDSGTVYEARKAGGVIVEHWPNVRTGVGPSLMRGWREALHCGFDTIVQIDAGGSHNPGDIPSLLYGDVDIVIGSRFLTASEYVGRQWRNVASRVYGYSMYARSGLPVFDWTSGFRVFTAEAVSELLTVEYRAHMHGWQAEVLLRAHELGLTVEERPIRYQAGDTSLRLPHIWEAVRVS